MLVKIIKMLAVAGNFFSKTLVGKALNIKKSFWL